MNQYFSTPLSVIILTIVKFLERSSYYGMRALIILYAMDTFALEMESTFAYYGYFTLAIGVIQLPMGLLSDLLLKQKNGAIIGFVLLVLGYGCLVIVNIYATILALILITLGIGLVGPNLTVLLGQLFKKEDGRRNTGFVTYMIGVNLGGLLGVAAISFVGETIGHHFGFAIAAGSALVGLIIFLITKNGFKLVENDSVNMTQAHSNDDPEILDHQNTPPPLPNTVNQDSNITGKLFMVLMIAGAGMIFWFLYEFGMTKISELTINMGNVEFMGMSIPSSFVYTLSSIFSIAVGVLFVLIFSFRKMISTMLMTGIAFLVLMLYMIILQFAGSIEPESSFLFIMFIFGLLAIPELVITGIHLSFITRLSPVGFASTIVGGYTCLLFMGNKLFNLIMEPLSNVNIILLAVIPLLISIVFILLRKEFLKLVGGLD